MASRLCAIVISTLLCLAVDCVKAQQSATAPAATKPAPAATGPAPAPALTQAQQYASLQQQLAQALKAKDYEKAADICRRQAALGVPDRGNAQYNLACALAQLGKKDDALAALDKAVEQGFLDSDHMKQDADLESLRSDGRFDKIALKADTARTEARARQQKLAALNDELAQQFGQKEYEQARKTAGEIIELAPNDPSAHYNLACAQARLKQVKDAVASLTKAVELGYANAAHMKADDDLATLRDDPAFKALLAKAAEAERAAFAGSYRPGKEIAGVKTLEAYPEGGLRYRLRMSPTATAEKPSKLIVWLHPSGDSMNDYVETMAPMFIKNGYAVVVFTQKNFIGWGDSDDRKLLISLAAVGKTPGIDASKPILMGYSAGGQLALLLWAQDPAKFGGLVLDAAYPVRQTAPTVYVLAPLPNKPGIKDAPVLALVGTADGGSRFWQQAEKPWRDAGIPLQVIYVPGKPHTWLFDTERTRQLDQWLAHVAAGKKPSTTAPAATKAAPATE